MAHKSPYLPTDSFDEFYEINEDTLYGMYTGEIYSLAHNIEERDFELFKEREYERTQNKSAYE